MEPFLLRPICHFVNRRNECLTGHFARPNEQWKGISGQEVLVIFHGPHHYISSSWYETNMSVPTWNYIAVHVYGTIELMEDSEELLATLDAMVKQYEKSGRTYSIDESNEELIKGLMKGIVGFRIKMNRIEGNWKLSQNHSPERQSRVIEALENINSEDAAEVARLMRKNLSK
jgi:transcriptional regulator